MKGFLLSFALGAAVYPALELVWRGWSHWSMAVAGGLGLNALRLIARRRCSLYRRCVLGALALTLIELVAGLICNKWLRLSVWDYSHLPANLWGQICLPFCGLWFLLCIPVFLLLGRRV